MILEYIYVEIFSIKIVVVVVVDVRLSDVIIMRWDFTINKLIRVIFILFKPNV